MITFVAAGGGAVRAHVESAEAELLSSFIGQVATLLEDRSVEVGAGTAVGADPADDEAALLSSLEQAMAPVPDPDDDVLERLLPAGRRPSDGERVETVDADTAEFRRLTEADLRRTKLDDAHRALDALRSESTDIDLDAEQADALLRALNDVRLSLGVRLEITEETPFPRKVRDERDQALRIYFWTGGVQEELLTAIIASGPTSD